ncbi:hypothetical protein Rs2_41707 [Raphanus sativus]|nr:hypothetical protein Rs2_41707 [Raphanus sativus]
MSFQSSREMFIGATEDSERRKKSRDDSKISRLRSERLTSNIFVGLGHHRHSTFMYVIGGGPPSSEKASNVTIMSLEIPRRLRRSDHVNYLALLLPETQANVALGQREPGERLSCTEIIRTSSMLFSLS